MATSRAQRKPLTEFHPFSRLPIEIRHMIWSWTFPSRVIDIFAHTIETWTGKQLHLIPERFGLKNIMPEPGKTVEMDRIFARLYPTPLSAVNREARSFLPQGGCKYRISTDLTLPEDYARVKMPKVPGSYDYASGKCMQRNFLANERNAVNFTKINLERDVLFLRALGSQHPDPPRKNRSFAISQTQKVYLGWISDRFRQRVRHIAINEVESGAWGTYGNYPFLSFPNLETVYILYDEYREIEMDCPYHPTKILRGRERAKRMKTWAQSWAVNWAERFHKLAAEHEEWHCPKIMMASNTKSLRTILRMQDEGSVFAGVEAQETKL